MIICAQNSKFAKEPSRVIINSIIICFLLSILFGLAIPNFKKVHYTHEYNLRKSCASTLKVLTDAVEMYNMDHESSNMRTLDMDILLKGQYIKGDFRKSYKECKYCNSGDLSKNGIIYCETHGDTYGIKIKQGMSLQDYSKEREKINREQETLKNEKQNKAEKVNNLKIIIIIIIIVLPLLYLISNMIFEQNKTSFFFITIETLLIIIYIISLMGYIYYSR
ncbi:MAG: hypothetical protein IKO19_00030 [Candidatus Riflebacteria bacterium]|nr:hypothetical protein [Candidatus Riflebacteria bacterium]